MPTVNSHQPGSFCCVELSNNARFAARALDTEQFRCTVRQVPIGDGDV